MPLDIPACQSEEDLLRTLIERSDQGFLVLRDECIIYANGAACRIFGCTSEEMIDNSAENLINIIPDDDVETDNQGRFTGSFNAFFSEKKDILPRKLQLLQKNGSNVWIQAHLSQINYQGTACSLVSFLDITEQERVKKDLVRCERELKALVENAPDLIARFDRKLRYIYVNPSLASAFGLAREQFLGKTNEELDFPDELVSHIKKACKQVFETGQEKVTEFHCNHENGKKYFRSRIAPEFSENSSLQSVIAITQDQSRQRQQEKERLFESEDKYRMLVEMLQEGVWALDREGFTTFANPGMAQMLGYSVEEMQGRHLFSFIDEHGAKLAKNYLERREQGTIEQHDFEFIRKDGTRIYTTLATCPIKDGQGNYIGALAGVTDITARKNAEDRLWKANRELVALNRCKESMAHAQSEELLLKEICKIVVQTFAYEMAWIGYVPDGPEKMTLPAVQYSKDGNIYETDIMDNDCAIARGPAGEAIWTGKPAVYRDIAKNPAFKFWHNEAERRGFFSLAAIPISIGCKTFGSLNIYSSEKNDFDDEDVQFLTELADSLAYGIKAVRDNLDRMQAEAGLREIEQQREALLSNIPDSVWLKDNGGRYIAVNKSFAGLCGRTAEEVAGKIDNEIWPGHLAERCIQDDKEVMQSRTEKCVVEPSIDKLGREAWIETIKRPIFGENGEVVGMVGIARDITARKKSEERLKRYSEHLEELVEERSRQLRDKERLAAIGETAVMIGHDLRNPLQAIVSTIYLAKLKVEKSSAEANFDKPGIISDLETLEKQSMYMNKIVCNLQDYSRPLRPDMVNLSLPAIIKETFASMNIPDNIEIKTMVEESIFLRGDSTMMGRVLINLISNAIEAMPQGGTLHLSASTTESDVILSIKDTGPGVPSEVKDKIFHPLITSKAKGMGMGLVVCKRLIEAMNGDIRIVSEKGMGTIAEVKIPRGSIPIER